MEWTRKIARVVAVFAVALGAGHLVQTMSHRNAAKPVASAALKEKPQAIEQVAAGPDAVMPAPAAPAMPKVPLVELAPPAVPRPAPAADPAPAPLVAAADCPVTLDLMAELREAAEAEAIRVFARNLKDLLLAAPAGGKATMGLDPGTNSAITILGYSEILQRFAAGSGLFSYVLARYVVVDRGVHLGA